MYNFYVKCTQMLLCSTSFQSFRNSGTKKSRELLLIWSILTGTGKYIFLYNNRKLQYQHPIPDFRLKNNIFENTFHTQIPMVILH